MNRDPVTYEVHIRPSGTWEVRTSPHRITGGLAGGGTVAIGAAETPELGEQQALAAIEVHKRKRELLAIDRAGTKTFTVPG